MAELLNCSNRRAGKGWGAAGTRSTDESSVCTAATGKEWASTASGQPRRNGKKNRASARRNVFVWLFYRLKVL